VGPARLVAERVLAPRRSLEGAARGAGLYPGVDRALTNGLPPRPDPEAVLIDEPLAARLQSLPRAEVLGTIFPVAETVIARLLGLAFLDREAAGLGLFIPRCRSVHTFGMRFPLDVYFLGRYGEIVGVRRGIPPFRIVRHPGAAAVLELPPEELDAA
jgi:uncharacterized membrane protein (UPF0127 family)